ncbi:hypothetical protein [Dendronalium sp. ChiSLP03b]|uniref:hypothetical protein n=1 Tax=Dendronalium sp. ChiSLP03b TaxID=3075381 RepID=UPI002AD1F9B0|nr:hypothetical protein [Dendronalium sp. ChiSLP03b]MDZ8208627.1 hypothetical protein [Dendronalium sp. ChiSLP03b]
MRPIKRVILTTLLASQIFLISIPVKAQTSSDPNAVVVDTVKSNESNNVNPAKKRQKTFLENTLDLYIKGQKYLTKARKYLDLDLKKFSIKWGGVNTELGKAIAQAIKDGNKDPYKTGDSINDAVANQSDSELINTNSRIQGENAEKEIHQLYTRAQSQAFLGAEGQKNQADSAEISDTAVTDSLQQAEAAQKDVVTQDILKKMAVQNLQTVMITKSLHGEAQQQTQLLATTNMNLADISEQMSDEERKRQAESAATSREILRAGAASDAFWENQ